MFILARMTKKNTYYRIGSPDLTLVRYAVTQLYPPHTASGGTVPTQRLYLLNTPRWRFMIGQELGCVITRRLLEKNVEAHKMALIATQNLRKNYKNKLILLSRTFTSNLVIPKLYIYYDNNESTGR